MRLKLAVLPLEQVVQRLGDLGVTFDEMMEVPRGTEELAHLGVCGGFVISVMPFRPSVPSSIPATYTL